MEDSKVTILDNKSSSAPSHRGLQWREVVMVAFILMIIAVPLSYVHSIRWIDGGGDTAFLTEMARNIGSRGLPYTQLNASVNAAEPLWGAMAEDVCKSSLTPPDPPEMNQLKRHTYLIIYALAPFLRIFDASVVLPSAMVASFMMMLFFMYLLLRERGVAVWASSLFVLTLTFFPAWSLGVQGQIYVDRLFVGLAALCLYLLSREEPPVGWLILAAVLAASVVERAAIILGGILIGYAIIHAPSQSRKKTKSVLAIGVGIFLAGVIILKWYLESPYYKGFVTGLFTGFSTLIENQDFVAKMKVFLVFNLGLFGVLAIFAPRIFLLAILAMLPNILGTIGGAEKTGWLTHYHSIYLPFIVWAAAMGFANLWQWTRHQSFRIVLTVFVVIIGFAALTIKPYHDGTFFSMKYAKQNVWPATQDFLKGAFDSDKGPMATTVGYKKLKYKELHEAIPKGASVTTVESAMPTLILDHVVHYYPIAIDSADYALLTATEIEGGGYRYEGEINYNGPEQKRILNECLNRRLRDAGYNVDNPKKLIGGFYLLTRKENTVAVQ